MRYGAGPVKLDQDNNPGGARWCPEHGRLECTGNRKRGLGVCHAPAVRGGPNCKRHSGATFAVAKAKGEARISAWTAIGKPQDGKQIEAGMAVMGMLQQSWLRCALYSDLLRQQVEKEGGSVDELKANLVVEASGLIGYRFGAAGKEGHIYATNEEVRALVSLEAQERDRVVKYAETAHKMGISERMTTMAERWGDLVISRLMVLFQHLDLTPAQYEKVPGLIQAHIGSIDITAG